MLAKLRSHLTYANVMATIAVFIALGGSSYAALHIGSRQIVNNSIRSKDIRNNNLRGKDIRIGTIGSSDVRDDSLSGADIQDGAVGATDLGPIVEVSATSPKIPDTEFGGAGVSCPAGTRVISGGAASSVNRMYLMVSQRSGNGWSASVHNLSGGSADMTVRAYCLE
jgi:hypothetical protein